MNTADSVPDDIDALHAELTAERAARREAEARAIGAEAMVTHLKLVIAKLEHHRYGASSERGRKLLDQAELQLEELEADAAEAATAADAAADQAGSVVRSFTRRKPVRGPLPAHLPRERVVIPGPTACPCCGGALSKLGETITETLESVPRQWKVIQTVREKFACRACETITQPPAPFHPIARGRAGPNLLAMILDAKFGNHQPLNRQSETYAREGIDLDVSTLADWVGACTATLSPLVALIRDHVLAAERIHGDDTTVPVLAKGKTITGRLWTYVRDDRPFGGSARPAAMFYFSRDRRGEHPNRHLAGYGGILQADAYAGFGELYSAGTQALRADRGSVLGTRKTQLLQVGRARQSAARDRGGATHRRNLRPRAHDQWSVARAAAHDATGQHRSSRRRPRILDARRTPQDVAARGCGESDRLHAQALAIVPPVPR